MFCPQCGTSQGDEMKFCKSCGANLAAVRQAATTRESPDKRGWGRAWMAEMRAVQEEQEQREWERKRQIPPEEKRYNEIKAGVITSSIGLGLMIFLSVFMQGIIAGSRVSYDAAQILSHLWVIGVIPLFIGAGLLINGVFVSKQLAEFRRQELRERETNKRLASVGDNQDELLPTADWSESDAPKPSVTEHTTRQLENSRQSN